MTAFDGKKTAAALPLQPGVYRMLDAAGRIIYVGKAKVLRKRVSSYFNGKAKDNKTMSLVNAVCNIQYDITRSDGEALILENQLIKKHTPRYNVLLKDGKSYPYIYCSSGEDEFPRLEFRRGAKRGPGQYFGPFPSAASVRNTLNFLQKVFQVRQCNNTTFANRSRPCLQHQIGRCTAPCVGRVSPEAYQEQLRYTIDFLNGEGQKVVQQLVETMDRQAAEQRYEEAALTRDRIKALRLIQSRQFVETEREQNLDIFSVARQAGIYIATVTAVRNGQVLGHRDHFPKTPADTPLREFLSAFISQYYFDRPVTAQIICNERPHAVLDLQAALTEMAGKNVRITAQPRGARRKMLDLTQVNMHNALKQRVRKYASWQNKWRCWEQDLGLPQAPRRVECFDISHTFGDQTRASCVVFDAGGACRKAFRQYKIEGITAGDDYAAMRQVIDKRLASYTKHGLQRPDVYLIDGGKGQVNQVAEQLQAHGVHDIALLGVVKDAHRTDGEERLYIHASDRFIKPEADDLLSLMIRNIRDEAHNHAIGAHRKALKNKRNTSPLESIDGVGPRRRAALLKHFGGLQGLKKAAVDDMARIPGISRKLAGVIFDHLKKI